MSSLRPWWVPFFALFAGSVVRSAEPLPLAGYAERAAAQGIVLEAPTWAHSPDDLQRMTDEVLRRAETQLAAIASLAPAGTNFAQTAGALDAILAEVNWQSAMLQLQRETSLDAALRAKAGKLHDQVEQWVIAVDYRDDVYQVIQRFASSSAPLAKDERRLLDERLRDYRRAGLALPAEDRREVERLRKELTEASSGFSRNITQARAPLDFTAEELAGVPPSFLESPGVKQPGGQYRALANVTWQYVAISENATNEETRKRFYLARSRLAQETNTLALMRMVNLRADVARRLGYATWADYQLETRMAKTAGTALKFEEDLVVALQPKFTAELALLQGMKAAETGHADAVIESWDTSYYINQLKKQKYAVDAEQLRVYFRYEATLAGMFRIYERLFGLTFAEVVPPDSWVPGLKLFVVTDTATAKPMGLFYLDMFPREGKYMHNACAPLRFGRFLPDGKFEAPVAALVCNLSPAGKDKPSLLTHAEVITLFHEFGHVMHALMSRARFVAQTADGVPRDFIEAPSQMLENWAWDQAVLDTFAADYRDPAKKIPPGTMDALTQARRAVEGITVRRQLGLGLLDLALHAPAGGKPPADVVAATNAVYSRVTLPVPPGTSLATYFPHLDGYGASYYGYQWSKVISLDLASVFKAAPGGFLDEKVGRRLRDEIYGVGFTRDINESVERFLGRPTNNKAYLEYIGIP